MSTRSYIAIKTKEGNYKGIYCHWDGYPTNNGALLVDHYNDYDKATELISLGSLSSLREKISPNPNQEHTFEKPQEDVCIYYGRDRGEKNQEFNVFNSKEELIDYFKGGWCEYIYIYENNKWVVANYKLNFEDVDVVLEKSYQEFGISRLKGYYGYLTESSIKQYMKTMKAE